MSSQPVSGLITFKGNWSGSTEVALSAEIGSLLSTSSGGMQFEIKSVQNPLGYYLWDISGFFAEPDALPADNAVIAQAYVIAQVGLNDSITQRMKFAPPIVKTMARGGVQLWSPHSNDGTLKMYRGPNPNYSGGNAVTLSSKCWLNRYQITQQGRIGIGIINWQFISLRDPAAYL